MVRISMIYDGDLHVRAHHDPSGVSILTDAPVDNQGKGESFSPTDLVATALGSCMATTMGLVAKRHQIDLKGMEITVEKVMSEGQNRKIAALPVTICFQGLQGKNQKKILENAALTCPVHRSLDSNIEINVQFIWS